MSISFFLSALFTKFLSQKCLVALLPIVALLVIGQRSLPCFSIIFFLYCFSPSNKSLLSLYPIGDSDLTTLTILLTPNLTSYLASYLTTDSMSHLTSDLLIPLLNSHSSPLTHSLNSPLPSPLLSPVSTL